ncbi:hypothetical protein GWI33_009695, partial [Rhynchophorus ferrugineus]
TGKQRSDNQYLPLPNSPFAAKTIAANYAPHRRQRASRRHAASSSYSRLASGGSERDRGGDPQEKRRESRNGRKLRI